MRSPSIILWLPNKEQVNFQACSFVLVGFKNFNNNNNNNNNNTNICIVTLHYSNTINTVNNVIITKCGGNDGNSGEAIATLPQFIQFFIAVTVNRQF